MEYVYNKSTLIMENAKLKKCPRCHGFGANITDKGEKCWLCDGEGEVYLSDSGWVKQLNGDKYESMLF